MARFIMDNKMFDTETAEKLCEWSMQWEIYYSILGRNLYPHYDTTLYRTKKGNYFCVGLLDSGRLKAQLLSEEEAKSILMIHNYEKYCELYSPLEEG